MDLCTMSSGRTRIVYDQNNKNNNNNNINLAFYIYGKVTNAIQGELGP